MTKQFLANIYFLKESEGGRKTDIANKGISFRPMLCYRSNNYHCQLEFDAIESIRLGNSYTLKIKIIDTCPVQVSSRFELKEISIIGRGEIVEEL